MMMATVLVCGGCTDDSVGGSNGNDSNTLRGQNAAVECPPGTEINGSPPPVRRELLPPNERTEVPGVDCTSWASGASKQEILLCATKMGDEGYKQWCARSDGTMHGPYVAWDKIGQRRESGAFKEGKIHGVLLRWDHFGELSEIARMDEGKRHGRIWSFYQLFQSGVLFWSDFDHGKFVREGEWHLGRGKKLESSTSE